MHPVMVGLGMAEAVTSTPPHKTVADVVASMADFAAARPEGSPITSWGYDDSGIAARRHLTRHDLDLATPTHPVRVQPSSGHLPPVHHPALERVGIARHQPDHTDGRTVHAAARGPNRS